MRIRVCVNGNLHNVHLVVVPFFDRHTAENTTVCAPWQDNIIAITTDGENTNTGCRNGVVARLNRMATHQLMRVWCAPHQGDIVIRAATNEMDNGAFYKTAHAFSVHLRQQQNLILEMQVQYPPADNRILPFVLHVTIFKFGYAGAVPQRYKQMDEQWIEEKRPVSAPSPTWWVMCASVQPLEELCNTTMTILQSHDMILCQQMVEIKSLIGHLVTAMYVKADGNPTDDLCYVRGQYRIQTQSVREHIYDQGSWARDLFNSLSAKKTNRMCCMKLEERDERNNAGSIAPPVLPAQLVKLRTGTFISDVLYKYRAHIVLYRSAEDVEQVEADHRGK
ncbi:hypothetical protein PsorP6_005691 [Peronosclerospora sorghi]|uniref:Uncharacterized protein n=1 Tax=Peronosclerospora sorghi TaxID=230839 RepID=A0ACC0W3L2_9STRA|nr:hypothetical protein PsorP6_005691 [Peronosclerospora sorghi]